MLFSRIIAASRVIEPLRFVVNGFGVELFPIRIRAVDRGRAGFAVRRDSDFPCPNDPSVLHRGNFIGVIVYHFVGGRVPGHISLRWVGFSVPFADPDAVCRFPILIQTLHRYLDFIPLLRVNDRRVLSNPRRDLFLRFIKVPGANAFPLPDEIPFEIGAIMMCSSATALHALNKGRFKAGDSIAIFGFGGLGFSALQLARAFDCKDVYVVEINSAKLASAASMGAIAIDAKAADPVEQIKGATVGRGVDVAVELIGSAKTMRQAVLCVGALGRAALVGLTAESMSIFPYMELISKEAEIIGVSDHLASELPALIEFAHNGKLRFPPETLRVVDLDAAQIHAALDALQDSIDHVRTVI